MTAPAARLLQHQPDLRNSARTVLREPEQSASLARPALRGAQATAGFAAHLEQQSALKAAGGPSPVPALAIAPHPAEAALTQPALAPPERAHAQAYTQTGLQTGQAANPTEPGKPLPDKRQAAATTAVFEAASAETPTPAETSMPAETPASDASAEPALPLDGAVAAFAATLPLLTAPAAPNPVVPDTRQTGTAARLGAVPLRTAARGAPALPSAPAPAPSGEPAAAAAPNPADPKVSAKAAATALAFVLEADGPTATPAATPAAANPAQTPAQASAQTPAQPSTQPSTLAPALAALPGEPAPARNAPRFGPTKTETDTETARTDTQTALAEVPTAALALNQPAALAASSGPAAPLAAAPAERIDFDALVDSIARARDSANIGAAEGAPVAVAMQHSDFGRISLRFKTDADGLSVAMASSDPGFAPAAAAAHAAEAAAAAASSDPALRSPQNSNAASDTGSGQTSGSARGGSGQRQDNSQPQQQAFGQQSSGQNARAPRRAESAADTRRGSIFA